MLRQQGQAHGAKAQDGDQEKQAFAVSGHGGRDGKRKGAGGWPRQG
ncbi:Uncharacterised protein [Bordetella pertussis]|nr:Uncharacterised protein [Bordetella pertussis]